MTSIIATSSTDLAPIRAIAFNCSLKPAHRPSSTAAMLSDVREALAKHGVEMEVVHAAAHAILPGTSSDEGPGDAWPALRARLMAADIVSKRRSRGLLHDVAGLANHVPWRGDRFRQIALQLMDQDPQLLSERR